MGQPSTGTWANDPAHFRRPSRRAFLHVGLAGGLGLTLDQFFRLQARAETPAGTIKEAPAKSIIHIFLPGGMAHQDSFDPKPFAPIEYRGEMGTIKTKLDGVLLQRTAEADGPGRRQDHRLPVDDARRGGPRARHAQHVHRLPAQPGPGVSRAWAASSPTNLGRATTCRPMSASPASRRPTPAPGYLSSAFAPFSLGSDPANGNFTVQDLNLPGGVDDKRFTTRRSMLEAVNDHFAGQGESRRPGGHGHLLPAGLQPDQLAEGPRGVQHQRRAAGPARRVRPQRGRPAHAAGPAAGRPRASASCR